MTKKIFLIFTIVMVFITGTACYAMILRAKNNILQKSQTRMDNSELPPMVCTPIPLLPETTHEEKQPSPTPHQTTLTNKQKYYRSLSDSTNKNILLIGKDPLYSNFDTIVIASINEKKKAVYLVDFPRDIYIDYTSDILKKLKKSSDEFYHEKGSRKLNAAPVVGRKIQYSPEIEKFPGQADINFLADLIEEVFDMDIIDYVSIETNGFRELVDYFGGVDIDVPIYMHYEDPLQNLYIHIEPGFQTLNGAQAEGFVRFRQGYTREGELINYPRSQNTFLFLKAFFKQHVTFRNLSRIGKVYNIVKENTATSVESIKEIYPYALLAKKILEDEYVIESVEIECNDSKTIDGALYDILKTH